MVESEMIVEKKQRTITISQARDLAARLDRFVNPHAYMNGYNDAIESRESVPGPRGHGINYRGYEAGYEAGSRARV